MLKRNLDIPGKVVKKLSDRICPFRMDHSDAYEEKYKRCIKERCAWWSTEWRKDGMCSVNMTSDVEILRMMHRIEERIDNLATDQWGGAGPDCIAVSGGARYSGIKKGGSDGPKDFEKILRTS